MSSHVRVLFDVLCPNFTTFTAARRGGPCSISFGSFRSGAVASGGEDRRGLGEKGVDALFDIGAGEDPVAVGQSAGDRLLGWVGSPNAHARPGEEPRKRGA